MSQVATAPPQVPPEVHKRAAQLAAVGLNADEIATALAKDGIDPELANKIATKCAYVKMLDRKDEKDTDEDNGRKNLISGALMLLGGVVFSLISYHKAGPGGTFFVSTGAIFGGIALFVKGLFDAASD